MEENILLYRNYMILRRIYDKNAVHKIKRPIFPLLHFIYTHNNYVKISEVVEEFSFSKGRITQVINSLIEDDLIIKILENNSRKKTYISLTEKGIKYFNEIYPIILKKADRLAEYMGDDLVEFNRLIDKLLKYEEKI